MRKTASKRVWTRSFGTTDVGRTRTRNEDCFLIADLTRGHAIRDSIPCEFELGERGSFFVVADGMGGAAAGALASAMATDTAYSHLLASWTAERAATPDRFVHRLTEALEVANGHIHSHAASRPELRGMGTTATAAGLLSDHVYLAQVGDSRAYLVREGEAYQLTKDQSLVQRLIDAGELTDAEAAEGGRRNVILQALGPAPQVRVAVTYQQLRWGDILVLCSDGLSSLVKPAEIARIAATEPEIATACKRLVDLANEKGGTDNITVVLVRLAGDGLQPPGCESAGYRLYNGVRS
ncbi:MAG TPA: protein phosphatase 2C domain-containing protein [Methylomirabilota bacterium]|nr:protein phosphatase 2C domain-containing protein [Methylomirabilota bacterium]